MHAYEIVDTPDGPFTVIERPDGVVVAAGWSADPAAVASRSRIKPGDIAARTTASADAVRAWYAGDTHALDAITVEQSGTAFQSRVWAALREIPAGEVRRYGEVAESLGTTGASRAVGAACGRNAVALFVPCHRVVGASGKLTGFAWGVDVKRSLLTREGSVL
ncbi:methylated-DNA--[protein]-cysteine S-methyltransferase [Demequina aurantiaca]|uniref:methylated-DNA--[protein]-cysteine S-methyltransferase n=1 Tax=Demequina aurantiaca TaxID=676200 RepID=UPI000780EE0B|nr:methylated-DNA--[protein]-cysteine S-methyltransferase [Demequina aurantiaca]